MCGIVGIIQYESRVDRVVRAKALRILFSDIMLLTEPRGDDATGIYQVHADGDWMMAKKGQKVSQFLYEVGGKDDPITYSDFMGTWDQHEMEMTALVGHCRKATVGSRGQNNDDNHPFAVQLDERNAILGVHNGTLTNHETIFKNLTCKLPRQGSVDSESIFHLMYEETEKGTKHMTGDILRRMGERIDGAYAVIAVNTRFPNQISVFREGRPTDMIMIAPLNIVILASMRKFVEEALAKYEFFRRMMDSSLPELTTTDRMLPEREYRIFDTTLPFPTGKLEWNDFDAVSEKGEMRRLVNPILDNWKPPASSSSNIYSSEFHGRHSAYHDSGFTRIPSKAVEILSTPAPTRTTTPVSPAALSGVRALPAWIGGLEEVTKVDAEIVLGEPTEKEATRGFHQAASLGLCVSYDSTAEVAKALGKTEPEINKTPPMELANELSKLHFNFGYAMGTIDSEASSEEVRRLGRQQLQKMERLAEKQKKAEKHIWELKGLLQIGISLAACGFPINERNAKTVLQSFKALPAERAVDVEKMLHSVLGDKSAQKVVKDLTSKLKNAAQQQKLKKKEHSSKDEQSSESK
jgi:hypothetical protein